MCSSRMSIGTPNPLFRRRCVLLAIVGLLLVTACDDSVEIEPGGPLCRDFSELECIDSAACNLTQPDGPDTPYICGSPQDHCGSLFPQGNGTEVMCESKPDCKFVKQKCYCPPKVVCLCSGGPPSQCVASTGWGIGAGVSFEQSGLHPLSSALRIT